MNPRILKQKISKLPKTPGVYRFLDARKKNLYIGKAANLKSRVASYRHISDTRLTAMLKEARSLAWQETASDIEALILESQLIKKHQPRYNITLRDDKQYFYVGFTDEEFPKIFLTHQPAQISKGETWAGPFTDGTALKTTLRLLRNIFPYCTCTQKHYVPCLNYHIGKCLGFCCLKQQNPTNNLQLTTNNRKEYQKNIKAIQDILGGKKTSLLKKLGQEMKILAKRQRFEEAIALQYKIEKVQRVMENARIIRSEKQELRIKDNALKQLKDLLKLQTLPRRIEGYDVSNIQGTNATGALVVFTDGVPDKNEYRKFKIRNSNIEILSKTKIQNPKRKKVSGFGGDSWAAEARTRNFALKFRAPDLSSGGDTTMLSEVLTRRFRHREWPLPDVVIVDGGKGQWNAARMIIPHPISIIALTKDEHHRGTSVYIASSKLKSQNAKLQFKNKNEKTVKMLALQQLPEAARNLILAIDAEAHRFAIRYYRSLHRRRITRRTPTD